MGVILIGKVSTIIFRIPHVDVDVDTLLPTDHLKKPQEIVLVRT
jgi:hypothetical protein